MAAPRPAPIRLIVNWTSPNNTLSGLWVAQEAGLFREHGLDVELLHIPNTSRAIQAMVAGEVQLSSLDANAAIQANLGGADTVLLFAATNRLIHSVLAQPSIREPQALRGKTLGLSRVGSASHTAALVALRGWGLVPDRDVALRQLGEVVATYAGLEAGQVDAGMMGTPIRAVARRAGFNELINLTTQGPDYPSVAMGGLRTWVGANEEAVRRFARGYALGIQRFKRDQAFAFEVYQKYLPVDDLPLFEDTYVDASAAIPDVPYVSEVGIARLLEDMAAEEPRLAGRQAGEFVDPRFVRELEESGFFR